MALSGLPTQQELLQASSINSNAAQDQQLRQLHGILGLLTGQGQNGGGGLLQALQSQGKQSLLDARNQAVQDTKGLNAAAVRKFETSALPQIQAGAEGAGASASALTALLAQKAGIDSAANVAQLQGNQIIQQENLANQANIAQGHDQATLISTMLSKLLQQFAPVHSSSSSRSDIPAGISPQQKYLNDLAQTAAGHDVFAAKAQDTLKYLGHGSKATAKSGYQPFHG